MADQLDRDYELLSYNTHPAQLFIYELRNNYIRDTNEQADKLEKGEDTIFSAFEAELQYQIFLSQENKPTNKNKDWVMAKSYPLKSSLRFTLEFQGLLTKQDKTTAPEEKMENSTIS